MKRRYVGALLETAEGNLLLHHRDNKPEIWNPDMVGPFGGIVEAGESDMAALIRELHEELALIIPEISVLPFRIFTEMENKMIDEQDIDRQIFLIKNVNQKILSLDPNEGQGIVEITKNQDLSNIKFTPLARYLLKLYWNVDFN